MTKKIYLETLKSVLGCSILHYSPWSFKKLLVKTLVAKLCFSYQLVILTLQYICRHRYYLWELHLIETLFLNSQIPHLHFDLTLGHWKTLCKNRACETVDNCLLWDFTPRRFSPWDCLLNVNFLDNVCCLCNTVDPWNHNL